MSNDFFDTKFDQILRVKMMFATKLWQSWKDQQVAPLAVTCLNPPPSAGSQSWPPGQDGVIPPRLKMQVTIKIGRFRNLSPGQNPATLLQNRPESSRPRRNTSHPLNFHFSLHCIMLRKLWFLLIPCFPISNRKSARTAHLRDRGPHGSLRTMLPNSSSLPKTSILVHSPHTGLSCAKVFMFGNC